MQKDHYPSYTSWAPPFLPFLLPLSSFPLTLPSLSAPPRRCLHGYGPCARPAAGPTGPRARLPRCRAAEAARRWRARARRRPHSLSTPCTRPPCHVGNSAPHGGPSMLDVLRAGGPTWTAVRLRRRRKRAGEARRWRQAEDEGAPAGMAMAAGTPGEVMSDYHQAQELSTMVLALTHVVAGGP
jgi:hypothetical protein